MTEGKILIIGLPRTATTSVCQAMLKLGYRTAHTCYTQACLTQAQVIADTPIFSQYQLLDQHFPNSKFILLERDLSLWLPSIRQLLLRMFDRVTAIHGGFNPHLKTSFAETFAPLTKQNIESDSFLTDCYQRHRQAVLRYFAERPQNLLSINVSDNNSFAQLTDFLTIEMPNDHPGFEPVNLAGKVTAWKQIKHPLKIESTRQGKVDSWQAMLEK